MSRSSTQRGYGYKWQKLRVTRLKRDKGLCQHCLRVGRVTPATEVDHIKRKADGGEDSIDNTQSLCTPCHTFKTRQENGARIRACGVDGYPLGEGG